MSDPQFKQQQPASTSLLQHPPKAGNATVIAPRQNQGDNELQAQQQFINSMLQKRGKSQVVTTQLDTSQLSAQHTPSQSIKQS